MNRYMSLYSFIKLLLISTFLFYITSCASIMKEDYEELYIESNPPGATATLNNGIVCYTPCNLDLERGDNYDVEISKPGYEKIQKHVSGSSWDGWLWGNLAFLIAAPIAVGVDFYTGYAYDFDPEIVKVDLQPSPDKK